MCLSSLYDVISVAVSLLSGVAFAALAYLNLLVTGITVPILALVLAFFALGAAAWGHARGLRCANQAPRLVIPALLLIAVAIFQLVFNGTALAITLITTFLTFGLMAYVLFGLFCFLTCRERAMNC